MKWGGQVPRAEKVGVDVPIWTSEHIILITPQRKISTRQRGCNVLRKNCKIGTPLWCIHGKERYRILEEPFSEAPLSWERFPISEHLPFSLIGLIAFWMGVLNENIATSWKLFVPYFSPYLRLGGKLHQGWHFFLPNQCNPIQESKSRKDRKLGLGRHLGGNPPSEPLSAKSFSIQLRQ